MSLQASGYGETTYKDLYYDNVFFDHIVRTEESSDYQREDYANCTVNAKYTGDRFIATHTLSLGWRRNPGSGSESTGTWTDNLFNSTYSSSRTSLRSIYPQISGNYYVKLSEKWHLPFSFEYIFSKNDASSSSCFGETPEINNNTGEKINTFTLKIDPWVKISKKMYLQMIFMSRLQWFDIDYSGSSDERHRQSRIRTVANLKLGWNPTRNLNITFNPGVDLFRRNIGDIHELSVLPTANTSIGWRLSRKYSMNCSLLFGVTPPTASESNPVLVKSSELMWVQGNPNLKNSSFWDVYLTNNLLLKDGVSLGGSFGYYYFSTDYTSFETGRKLCIDISYTFGFGRKVERNIDISGPNKVESGVNL